jgi:hypothetical protein
MFLPTYAPTLLFKETLIIATQSPQFQTQCLASPATSSQDRPIDYALLRDPAAVEAALAWCEQQEKRKAAELRERIERPRPQPVQQKPEPEPEDDWEEQRDRRDIEARIDAMGRDELRDFAVKVAAAVAIHPKIVALGKRLSARRAVR